MGNSNDPLHDEEDLPTRSLMDHVIRFSLTNRLIVSFFVLAVLIAGLMVAPFDWKLGGLIRDPVPVDAIPDIGENQQIVFTEWPGYSPQDIEDQITYPLSSALLALPGVKAIRAFSMFGFSSIYVIFDEDIDFYWSRTRILEKLSSLPSGTLPAGREPTLGPDATALGQIYWYTLEGRDPEGNPAGGWDLQDLRSVQDWIVRYALLAVPGVSEVASVGGYVKEYQVDVDPNALRAYDVHLHEVMAAVKDSNVDVGARTMEVNRVEYVIRGIGLLKSVEDLQQAVIKMIGDTPLLVKDVANVSLGPAMRRGALNKEGAEAVGGVVVVRYGYNPLEAINNVKQKIQEISGSLPKKELADGTISQLSVVPFYDRTELIHETLSTLSTALWLEVLVAVIVITVMLRHLVSSLIISSVLPLAVLICFIFMKFFGVDANIVSLSGIAIAIGVIVDASVVVCENIMKHLVALGEPSSISSHQRLRAVYDGVREVAGAILTAISTTIVSFLPVFTLQAAEGKLFQPLAFTKTFALLASVIIAFTVIPALAYLFLRPHSRGKTSHVKLRSLINWGFVVVVAILLSKEWAPLGLEKGFLRNFVFVGGIITVLLSALLVFEKYYSSLLRWTLAHKRAFLVVPFSFVIAGITIWMGMGKEFMPPLDEGAFLYMPTTMPHAAISESLDVAAKQNSEIQRIPEVRTIVGKLGRVESALDPAPISMMESVIQYYPEYYHNADGDIAFFKHDADENDLVRGVTGTPVPAHDGKPYTVRGQFNRDEAGNLIPDTDGMPFRLWRPPLDPSLNTGRMAWNGVKSSDDIWQEIQRFGAVPGSTIPSQLQPIMTRIMMLQTGMRAPMGLKIKGPTLKAIENAGIQLEKALKDVEAINSDTVTADRLIAKPYLEIHVDREAIAHYGIKLQTIQSTIATAIGGMPLTTTIEGRERYPVRVRYQRELRDQIEAIDDILVRSPLGAQIPLSQLARVEYIKGPQVIKSEDGFLVGYLTFDKKRDIAEVDVVHTAQALLNEKLRTGEIKLDDGVSYTFSGSFENQLRAEARLKLIVPATLFIIFILLYLQFGSTAISLTVYSGIVVAWSGGFLLLWFYGQPWFMNFDVFGVNMRSLFQMHSINLSIAIWVGFLALFGIASDIGVVVAAVIGQQLRKKPPSGVDELRDTITAAATRRIRPALMTSATTLIALLPVMTSAGRGSDIMIPMAIPSFGGMFVALISVFVVPVLYCVYEERQLFKRLKDRGDR
ncbi:hypothetical protein SCG7086_AI_00200 [Chlamydiales bacterium SCGC AG-110-P3]|nr:hypothetical protein SCG7086_AI_00200 [Chlamydiales bacterium SCGC AG-110-P3]